MWRSLDFPLLFEQGIIRREGSACQARISLSGKHEKPVDFLFEGTILASY